MKNMNGVQSEYHRWNADEKVQLVQKAAEMDKSELADFLRNEGIEKAEFEQLRNEVYGAALDGLKTKQDDLSDELSPAQKRVLQLENLIERKDQIVTEIAKLLSVRIPGRGDDEDSGP